MTSTNDSFIEEVSEAVRRERLATWLRRWGWVVALAILLVIALAGWGEWRRAQARALAELRGEAILTALAIPDEGGRLAALGEIPREGAEGAVAALVLAAQQVEAGDAASAAATLDAVAADGSVPALYRDLAGLKAQMARGDAADPLALQALAAPGAPFRLLAQEQLALLRLARGERDAAREGLQAIAEDAEASASQKARAQALLEATAGGAAPAAAPTAAPDPGPAAPGPGPAVADPGPAVAPDAVPAAGAATP